MNNDRIPVILLDDHPAIARGVASYLREKDDIQIVDIVSSSHELFKLIRTAEWKVLVSDLRLGEDLNGIEIMQRIRQTHPDAKVIFYSMVEEEEEIRVALVHGADGYVLKKYDADKVYKAIREVYYENERYISKEVLNILENSDTGQSKDEAPDELRKLTPKELEVLKCLGGDFSDTETADILSISEPTVRTHVSNLRKKLNASRSKLYLIAHKYGLVRIKAP